jgi:hypothetical protein
MNCRKVLALTGTLVVAGAAPAANAAAPTVTVRVEGKARTLLGATAVQTHSGWITKGAVPTGKCPAASGQGALDVATKHRWDGSFSSGLGSYFIKTILGETENGPSVYWSIFVNDRSATTGACGIKLHPGDQLLFAAAKYPEYPLAIQAPGSARVGHAFTAKVVWFNAKGKAVPLAGAAVSIGGRSGKTDRHGALSLTPSRAGTFVLEASHSGYIRAAAVRLRVS